MKVIHKFSLENCSANSFMPKEVLMPSGAEILKIDIQGSSPQIWALVETLNIGVTRKFLIFGTGVSLDELDDDYTRIEHLGTFFLQNFVWHVFEVA